MARTRPGCQILIYSLILAPLGCVPAIIGLGGGLYAIAACCARRFVRHVRLACYRERVGLRPSAPPRICSPIRCCICSCCSQCCSWSRASVWAGGSIRYLDLVMQDDEDERKRRQRKRSIAIAWALAASSSCSSSSRSSGSAPMSPILCVRVSRHERRHRSKRAGIACWRSSLAGLVAAMVGLVLRLRAALPHVLPGDRLWRRAAARRRRRRQVLDRTIRIRFDANVDRGAALDLRAGAADHGRQDRRDRACFLQGDQQQLDSR